MPDQIVRANSKTDLSEHSDLRLFDSEYGKILLAANQTQVRGDI